MIKVTNTILYSAFDNSFNFGCTMKLCNFLEIRIHILLKCNVQGRILCRPWEYSSPNQSDILDYSASNVSNTFLYFTHFWRCESKHFAAEIGSSWFKSNLSLVCQVICQNTSGMVYYTILGVIHLHLLLLDYPQCIIATLLLLESWVVCIIMTIQFSSWHRHLLCTILPFAAALSAVGARWRLLHFVVYYLQDSQHTPLRGYT